MNPKQKTALAISAPIVLLILQRFIPAGTLGPYLAIAAQVLAAVIAVVNVFHVPSWVVELLQAFLEVVTPAKATADTVPQIQPALMYRARKIVGSTAVGVLLALGVASPVAVTGCTPAQGLEAAHDAEALIAPGFECALAVILDLAATDDPAAIASGCAQFGDVIASDVVNIAKARIKQLPASDAGLAAISPTRMRLEKIAARKP